MAEGREEEQHDVDEADAAASRAPPRARRLVRRLITTFVALILFTVLVGSVFFTASFRGGLQIEPRFPLDAWLASLPSHLPWLAVFILFSASVVPLRAWRWGFTLPKPRPSYADRYHAVAIGMLANNVVPGKLGEAVRALSLSRFAARHGRTLPFTQSLGTILVCKLLDLVALAILISLSPSGPFFGVADGMRGGLVGVAIAVPLLITALFVVARFAPRLADALERKGRSIKLQGILRGLSVGVAASGSVANLSKALLATLVAISSVATGYTIALHGVGVEGAGLFAGVVILGAVTLGQSPPGIPAGLGVYFIACSWSARLLGATPEQAASVALLTHLATVFTHATIGGVSLLVRRVKLREFLPRRDRRVSPPSAGTPEPLATHFGDRDPLKSR